MGAMNVCTKFGANQPVDVEIFQWISENSDLMVVLQEKLRDHQSHKDESSGHRGYLCWSWNN